MTTIGRPKKSVDIPLACEWCKKKWSQPEWAPPKRFCSRECYHAGRTGLPSPTRQRRVVLQCERCANEFEAGGASGKKRWARFCSVACANASASQAHPVPAVLSAVDAAYLAGFLDGEGSLTATKPGTWRVSIYQCDEPVIRWIAEVTGTGLVYSRKPTGHNLVKQGPFKLGWVWQLYGRNAAAFLRQLLPYMHVKRARALEMLEDYPQD